MELTRQNPDIIIYDISSIPATELGRINTGAAGIMGVKIGPEGRIWYVDYDSNKLHRVEGQGVGINEHNDVSFSVSYTHLTLPTILLV